MSEWFANIIAIGSLLITAIGVFISVLALRAQIRAPKHESATRIPASLPARSASAQHKNTEELPEA